MYDFSIDYNIIDNGNINVHKYLMKNSCYKRKFGLIKKMLVGILRSIVSAQKYIDSNQR